MESNIQALMLISENITLFREMSFKRLREVPMEMIIQAIKYVRENPEEIEWAYRRKAGFDISPDLTARFCEPSKNSATETTFRKRRLCQKPSYTYLILNNRNGYTKIGRSQDPARREGTLQSQEPDISLVFSAITEPSLETDLHSMYEQFRIRGEWFNLSPEQRNEAEGFIRGNSFTLEEWEESNNELCQ